MLDIVAEHFLKVTMWDIGKSSNRIGPEILKLLILISNICFAKFLGLDGDCSCVDSVSVCQNESWT